MFRKIITISVKRIFRDLKALVAEVFMFSIKYGADFMKWSSSQVSRFAIYQGVIRNRRKWRRGEGRKMRKGRNERKREKEFRDKKREERKYSKQGACRKMSLVEL